MTAISDCLFKVTKMVVPTFMIETRRNLILRIEHGLFAEEILA